MPALHPMKASSKKLRKILQGWRKRKNGQFVVYSKDNKRFVVPLCYLNHPIFRVLLEMAEEEYGLPIRGPLRVPCEKELVEYILGVFAKVDLIALDSFKEETNAKILSTVLSNYV
ncbi:auxin-responsive protein SAUR66-like [Forsythia ovata]|uniref:Auxin-responsive protein SAUR66-like n=1 Tax=Forsythia ovata TaxID=205694 RepID=A0ABD1PW30_9LAMI